MALSLTNDTLPNGLVAPNSYVRVSYFIPERSVDPQNTTIWEERTRIHTKWYVWDGTAIPARDATCYKEETFDVAYVLTGAAATPDNVFKLAYDALKTLPEFSSAIDV